MKILGSCGFCYKCHKQILSHEEFLMMGNPMLLCNECQKYIELFKEFDKDLKEDKEE